jgi:hypothetical protein
VPKREEFNLLRKKLLKNRNKVKNNKRHKIEPVEKKNLTKPNNFFSI